jgi:hypothetical protein
MKLFKNAFKVIFHLVPLPDSFLAVNQKKTYLFFFPGIIPVIFPGTKAGW